MKFSNNWVVPLSSSAKNRIITIENKTTTINGQSKVWLYRYYKTSISFELDVYDGLESQQSSECL